MKKRFGLFLLVVIVLLGCLFFMVYKSRMRPDAEAPQPAVQEIRLEDFAYTPDTGYTFLPAPFGTSQEEMLSLFGHSVSALSSPYYAPTFQLLGLPFHYDADFSQTGTLFFLAFNAAAPSKEPEKIEAAYAEALAYFESAFGTASESETTDTFTNKTWWAKDNANYFRLTCFYTNGIPSGLCFLLCEPQDLTKN